MEKVIVPFCSQTSRRIPRFWLGTCGRLRTTTSRGYPRFALKKPPLFSFIGEEGSTTHSFICGNEIIRTHIQLNSLARDWIEWAFGAHDFVSESSDDRERQRRDSTRNSPRRDGERTVGNRVTESIASKKNQESIESCASRSRRVPVPRDLESLV